MFDYPERTFSRQAIRRVDQDAVDRFAMLGIVLMENAARGVAKHAAELLDWPTHRHALILCGGGNNGGDGFAAARHLHNSGIATTLILTKSADAYRGDAATNLAICRAMGLRMIEAAADPARVAEQIVREGEATEQEAGAGPVGVVVDALMGTGLDKPLRSPLYELVTWINEEQDAPVLAVDIPTGMDCDTGEPLGAAVRATRTASMVGRRRGFLRPEARRYTGDVYVVDIGVPRELIVELGDRLET